MSLRSLFCFYLKILLIDLFMRDAERERGKHIGRGRSRLPVGTPMEDSILGPRDHDLSRRQMLNP